MASKTELKTYNLDLAPGCATSSPNPSTSPAISDGITAEKMDLLAKASLSRPISPSSNQGSHSLTERKCEFPSNLTLPYDIINDGKGNYYFITRDNHGSSHFTPCLIMHSMGSDQPSKSSTEKSTPSQEDDIQPQMQTDVASQSQVSSHPRPKGAYIININSHCAQRYILSSSTTSSSLVPSYITDQPRFLSAPQQNYSSQTQKAISASLAKSSILLSKAQLPSYSCQQKLSAENEQRLKMIIEKKVHINFNGKSKLHPFPEIIGTVKIEDLLFALEKNLKLFFPNFKDVIVDIRLAGSGANSVLFGQPSSESLKDVDIVFYLGYCPSNPVETPTYLSDIARVFQSTLCGFVSSSSIPKDTTTDTLVKSHYLSNRKIVNDKENKWLIIGTGVLDLRFSVRVEREYTSSSYSHQVSLRYKNSYCLYGDREAAEKHFLEKRLVLTKPEEIPNSFARILFELNRHKYYSISDLVVIVEKYLKTASIESFVALLENHLSNAHAQEDSLRHVASILHALILSKSEEKEKIVKKTIEMIAQLLKISDKNPSFEDKFNFFIKKVADIEISPDSLHLLSFFYKKNPASVKECLIYYFEKTASNPISQEKLFEELLDMVASLDKEDVQKIFPKVAQMLQEKKNSSFLLLLSKRAASVALFLDKAYIPFYFSIIKSQADANDNSLLCKAIDLFIATREIFPSDTYTLLNNYLLDRCLKAEIMPRVPLLEGADSSFFKNRALINKLLDFAIKSPSTSEKENVDAAYIVITKLIPPTISSTQENVSVEKTKNTLSADEFFEKTAIIYFKKISNASSINEFTEALEDLSSNPLFADKNELRSMTLNKIEELLPSLSFKNYPSVLNFIEKLVDLSSKLKELELTKLQKVTQALIYLLFRASSNEVALERKIFLLNKMKDLFLKAKKNNLFSAEELSELSLEMSFFLLKETPTKESLGFLFFNLPAIKEKNRAIKIVSSFFLKMDSSSLLEIFKKHEDFLLEYLDKSLLTMLYISLIEVTQNEMSNNKLSLELIYLLEKSYSLKLHFDPSFVHLLKKIVDSLVNINLSQKSEENELFLKKAEALFRFLDDPNTNIDLQTKEKLRIKCFSHYLNLYLLKTDGPSLKKALDLYDKEVNLQTSLLLIFVNFLSELSKKAEDWDLILSLLKKIAPCLKQKMDSALRDKLSSFLSNYLPNNLNSFIKFLKILDLLISLGVPIDEKFYMVPLEYLSKAIKTSANDETKKEDALIIYKTLQNTSFWTSTHLEKEKIDLFFELFPLFSERKDKISIFTTLTKKNITTKRDKILSNQENPWCNVRSNNYSKIHSTLISWLSGEETVAYITAAIEFYDLISEYGLNSKESFAQKKETFLAISDGLMKKVIDKHRIDHSSEKIIIDNESGKRELVETQLKTLVAWINVVGRNLKNMSSKNFDDLTFKLAGQLSLFFPIDNHPYNKLFYDLIYEMHMEEKFDNFLKHTCNTTLAKTLHPSSDTYCCPTEIIIMIATKKFPNMLQEWLSR